MFVPKYRERMNRRRNVDSEYTFSYNANIFIDHLFSRVILQQEVRDRWFLYYISISGGVLAILSPIILDIFSENDFKIGKATYASIILFAMCIIGNCFFMIYIRQRKNYLDLYKKMNVLEEELILDLFKKDDKIIEKYNKYIYNNNIINKHGADYYTIFLQISINAIYVILFLIISIMIYNGNRVLSDFQQFLLLFGSIFYVVLAEYARVVSFREKVGSDEA